jgi:CRISPR-associated exonuclease Cas4
MGKETMQTSEWIPISLLNAYVYCPRRFYYEFALAEMVVNEHVFEGQQLHERVDQFGSTLRDEKMQLRHIYLCSPRLGLVGYCDLLEVEGAITDLSTLAMQNKLYPVEYKKGKMGKWLSDHAQLCAQALALEEVLNVAPMSIQRGYVFYISSARRDEVIIDEALRKQTLAALAEARHIAMLDRPPAPITNWRKCRDCSLEPICLPREVLALQARKEGGGNGDSVSY